jgi:predicted N-acetyltransferase YhbS
VKVRPERPEDAGAVRTVHERAFAPSGVETDLVDALPDEAWMIHRPPAYREDARGTVAYAEAFAAAT